MSQWPTASRLASQWPLDGQRITLPPLQLQDDPPPGGRQGERQQGEAEGRGYPPKSPRYARTTQTAPSGEDWRSSGPSRVLDVHSILNPAESEAGGPSSRRLSVATTESPQSGVGPDSQFGASPVGIAAHPFQGQQPPSSTTPVTEADSAACPRLRRILTPRSPFSSRRGAGPATIDAHRSPFLPSRGRPYTAEPGPSQASEVPPMPTPPGQTQAQQQYGLPQSASTPTIAPRRASGSTMQVPGRTQASQSASPSISASSYNPSSSQTSPASVLYHKGGQTPQTTYPESSFGTSMVQQQGNRMQFQGPSGQPEGPYSAPAPQTESSSLQSSSAGSSRQTSASDPVHVLTFSTPVGTYQILVNVHQASRLADEKRARNAGASARLRQRQKEKGKEANSNIKKLQQQTRELERKIRKVEQERDFYRAERDRFRDVVYRTPDLVMQAPPSPQSMRPGSFQGSMSQMGNPPLPMPPSQMGFQAPESTSERAPRRRRTDAQGDFTSLPLYTLSPASTLPPAGYPPGPGQGPTSLPPLRIDNMAVPLMTSANLPTAEEPHSRGFYERGWPGERTTIKFQRPSIR